MKRLDEDEEKYNNKKNGYFFSVENKNSIRKNIYNISRNNKDYTNNLSYDEKNIKDNFDNINDILLPKIAYITHSLSYEKF